MSETESQGSGKTRSSISSEVETLSSNKLADSQADTDSSGYEQRTATGLGKKRKSESCVGNVRKKRYNDQYRQLLNDAINAAVDRLGQDEYERTPPSQHGVSWWTADEKAIMFNVLTRKGENDIRSIAAAIRTKSEMEVRVYLQSVRKALESRLRQPRADRLSLVDVPAAAEIGEECCYVLDQHARTLSSLQQVQEEKVERQKHADLWLLTHDIAKWIEDHMEDESLEGADIRERLPAVGLLNLPKWLELSERIFMNPASPREDENWRNAVEGMDTPSIMHTAFSDFHTLAVSITKRLVQSSLFHAMSRLRATDSSRNRYRPLVRAKDVRVAVQILGMKLTAYDSWTRAPRRCNLHIYQGRGKSGEQIEILDYDQVERLLSRRETEEQHKDKQIDSLEYNFADHESDDNLAPAVATATTNQESDYETCCRSSNFTASNDSSSIEGESQIETDQERSRKPRRGQRQLERDEDDYMETFDQQVSQAEEKRICDMLGETLTSGVKAEDIVVPKGGDIRGKVEPNLVQWRDKTVFWSDWETLNTPISGDYSGLKIEVAGLHDGLEPNEDGTSVSTGRCPKARIRDAEDHEGLVAESAEIHPEHDVTAEHTSVGSANDDVESRSDASENRTCRADLVDNNSRFPLVVNRDDLRFSPGSAYEDRSSMELDVDPRNHNHDTRKEEMKSQGDDQAASTPGSEGLSTFASAHSSHQSPPKRHRDLSQ